MKIFSEFKTFIAIIITVATLSVSAVIFVDKSNAETLAVAEKRAAQLYADKANLARIEEQLKNLNEKLDRILKKLE